MTEQGPNRSDLDALKDGAAMLLQAGNRVAALSLLWSAVAIDPTDLSSHRRLAATLANGGDVDGAADEFARYIEFVLPLGDIARATMELSYGVNMIGGHQALHGAADKIASAVRALVPAASRPALAPSVPVAVIDRPTAPAAAGPIRLAPLPTPRLLPKVPFRFCLHDAGDRHWMQLEGGTTELLPDAVRIVDKWENVIEERLCMPLRAADAHGSATTLDAPPVAWVVLAIANHVAAAYDAARSWSFTFQAKVHDEWLALDLVDTGCRLGRAHAIAAS